MTGTERRRAVLDEIAGCVCRDRQNSYGDAEDNFKNIADLANVVLQRKLSAPLDELDVAMFSTCIKLARTVGSREYLDNLVDLAGYSVCAAGIIKKWNEDRLGVAPQKPQAHQMNVEEVQKIYTGGSIGGGIVAGLGKP